MSIQNNSSTPARFLAESVMAETMPWDHIRSEQIIEPDHLAENPPCRRSAGDTARLLAILDELESGEGSP